MTSFAHDPNEIDLEFLKEFEQMGQDEDPDEAERQSDVSHLSDVSYVGDEAPEGEALESDLVPVDASPEAGEDEGDEDSAEPQEAQPAPSDDVSSDDDEKHENPDAAESPAQSDLSPSVTETDDEEPRENESSASEAERAPSDHASEHTQNDEPKSSDSQENSDSDDTPQNEVEVHYDDLPTRDPRCENHCEDNIGDDDSEVCECCMERMRREREQWGTVATDRNGTDLLPGDKVRVAIPHPLVSFEAILTVNVPNEEVDRVAVAVAGTEHPEFCWLSNSQAVSAFTGFHLKGDGAIWTFPMGKVIKFVEKINLEPNFEPRDPNSDSQQDLQEITDQDIEDFQNELDNLPETEHPEDAEAEDQDEDETENSEVEVIEDDQTPEFAEPEDEDDEDDELPEEKPETDESPEIIVDDSLTLTATQQKRFDNLTERIVDKIKATFGNTLEAITVSHVNGSPVATVKINSRGVLFTMVWEADRMRTDA